MIYVASFKEDTADKLSGAVYLNDIISLNKVIADTDSFNNVIMKKDFVSKYFTPTSLGNYISNAKLINPNLVIELAPGVKVITQDGIIDRMRNIENLDDILYVASRYEKEFIDCIKDLIAGRDEIYRELVKTSSMITSSQLEVERLTLKLDEKEHQLNLEINNKQNYADKLHNLVSRINYQYNKNLDANNLFEVRGNSYTKILYIKEITRVQYVDSLVYYLAEILKVLYNMPTRVVCIENYYAKGKVHLYPNLVPHYKLTDNDIINGNILMLGMQPKLMTDLMKNPSGVSIMIVLDRGGYDKPHLVGDNIEYLWCVSDTKDISESVPRQRVISYKEDTLFIPYVQDFDKYDNTGKIGKYSDMGIVQKIIRLLEKGGA